MAILQDVRETAQKRLLFLAHAIRQMSRLQRMISSKEVELVSCLMLGFGNARCVEGVESGFCKVD
jgi:hypothetical protein